MRVPWVALAHPKCEIHVTIDLFGTSHARRLWERQIAYFCFLFLTETVLRVDAVDNRTDSQIELEVRRTLEPRAAGMVFEAWLHPYIICCFIDGVGRCLFNHIICRKTVLKY